MKMLATGVTVIAATAGAASAGGLDRTGQPIQALFEEGGANGNYVELGFARSFVSLDGKGVGISDFDGTPFGVPGGTNYSNVGNDFNSIGAAAKFQFSDQLSGALIFENPYGADVTYSGDPSTTELGGTSALAETTSLTFYLRYKFDDRWSAHGGVRVQNASGDITLSGRSYGMEEQQAIGAVMATGNTALAATANGYNVELEQNYALGYVIGGAYEIPEIAGRVSLTYNSAIVHDMDTKESGPKVLAGIDPTTGAPITMAVYDGKSKTEVKTPQSLNLEFRTGIAADTLLFGSVRWVDWSEFRIDPKNFESVTGSGLVDLEDTTTFALGIGRRFNEQWAGSIAASYEAAGDKLVSPLAPTTGLIGLQIGASYTIDDIVVTGGVRQTWLGDAIAETGTPDTARADFADNTATTVGLRIGYNF